MFKKFKDKLAEEMKQSPARLQASVQQLAQAVVSPALSNSSIQEVSASNDNFSLTEDGDETPKNTPVKHSFQNVDLMSPSANTEISRRSSVSSITSDASSLFPIYESPPNLYQLQSDMDQSASEVDDNISPHLDRVTKDQLYSAYRKVQAKYHKYRGRYTDLATHYRELDRVKTRLESVLVETQDKVLRRITDLKEQCQLEQQAKAHLEEALRNDIEEKDHIINTLNTKVKLLQAGESALENSMSEETVQQEENSKDNLIDLTNESSNDTNSTLLTENAQLNDRMKKLESLVLRYKESLKRNKDKFTEVMKEKNTLENKHEALKNTTAERISAMEGELSAAQVEVARLTEQVDVLHKREEEFAISLAENKLSVHRELEEKEEQIKQLQIDLKYMVEEKESLNEAVTRCKSEASAKSKSSSHVDSNSVADKGAIVHDASKEKTDSSVKSSVQQAASTKHHEEVDHGKEALAKLPRDENALEEATLRLREKETEVEDLHCKLDELEKQNVEYRHDKETLKAELSNYKVRYSELKNEHNAQRIITEERRKDADATIEKLQATVQSVDKELENMRDALIDRDQVCENYNKKVQQYAAMLEKAKHRLGEQETQIKSLKSRLDELTMAQQELENKRTELNVVRGELELCRSMIDDLHNKVQADSSAINLLKKERSDLINRLVHYKDCVQRLKQDCANVKGVMYDELSNRRAEMSNLNVTLATTLARLEEENAALNSRTEELRSQMQNSERSTTSEEARLQAELDKIKGLKSTLETMLRANKEESMAQSDELSDELGALINKLIAEMDNLQFKIYNLEKVTCELTESRREAESLRERLATLEDFKFKHQTLSSEVDDLRRDLAQASRTADEVDELSAKLREANNLINSLKSQSNDQDALREEELRASQAEIARFKGELVTKDHEIKSRNEKIAQQEQQMAHLISTCDSHIQTIEEHVRKYLNLEEEYQTTRESHAKQTTELMESNKDLQKTLNVKTAQLKKLKTLKEQQSKINEEMNAELYELKTKHTELTDTLAVTERQIEALKSENSQLATINLENKDLKDKHNNLLSQNRKLCENEEMMKQKFDCYEKNIEELRKEVDSYKVQANNRNEEAEHLSGQLTAVNTQLEYKNAESSALNDRLLTSEKELRETKERLEERSAELLSKVSELNAAAMNGDVVREENKRLLVKLKSFKNEVGRIKNLEDENTQLRSQLGDLTQKNAEADAIRTENDRLVTERAVLKDKVVEMEGLKNSNAELQSRIFGLDTLSAENERLRVELDVLRSTNGDSSTQLSVLKDSLSQKETDMKSLEKKNMDMLQEIENLKLRCAEVDEKSQEVDTLKKKVAELQSEIASLDALRKDLKDVRSEENDKLREENKRLEAQINEALITFQAKETQMQLVNNEMKEQLGQKEQARTNEEEQSMRLKQLVKEFQAQLHDKEEELQAALEKRFDRLHNYKSDLVQQYKEQLKDFQVELTEKSEQIEGLVLEKKDVVAEKSKDIDRLMETIVQLKNDHANEIREVEKKWKAIVQQRIDNLQAKHEEELNAAAMNGDVVREENKRLLMKLKSFKNEVGRIKNLEDENTQLCSQLGDLTQKNAEADAIRTENDRLVTERAVLKDKVVEMEGLKNSNAELQSRIFGLDTLSAENERLRVELDALRSTNGDSSTQLSVLKDSLSQKETDMKSLEKKNMDMLQEIENLKLRCAEVDEKSQEVNTLKKKVAGLQSKIASLDALRKDLKDVHSEEDDKLREENKRLEAQIDEALITFQAKETQMQLVNNEMKEQLGQLKEQARTNEEEQSMRLKQLVKEFQAQLHDKEEELQAALEKRFDRLHNYESDLVQQYKEQLKDFQVELTEKSEQIESLVLEKKDVVAEKSRDIDRLMETIAQLKNDHANEIREVEKKWKAIVQQRIDNLQAKHEEELNELTKEWQNERKPDVQTEAAAEELESTSRVAMAAIQTNTGSIHTMQQTLTSQRREITELRKLVKLRHDTLEDSTEIEYLRNILFEYMMGRETMVLARVIAAVVKFDQEQTTKIMKKEEDKLTLFGSLGLT